LLFFLPSSKYGTRKSSSSGCFAIHTLRDLRSAVHKAGPQNETGRCPTFVSGNSP
jgi:hypothetical protein